MKKIIKLLSVLALAFTFVSCTSKKDRNVLRMNMLTEPDSFFPWESAATDTSAVNYNIYEGLMGFDSTGAVSHFLQKATQFQKTNFPTHSKSVRALPSTTDRLLQQMMLYGLTRISSV